MEKANTTPGGYLRGPTFEKVIEWIVESQKQMNQDLIALSLIKLVLVPWTKENNCWRKKT